MEVKIDELRFNGKFYIFLKETITGDILTDSNREKIFNIISSNISLDYKTVIELIKSAVEEMKINNNKKESFKSTFSLIEDENDFILYRLSCYLIHYRSLFLEIGKDITIEKITNNAHTLSKNFDDIVKNS